MGYLSFRRAKVIIVLLLYSFSGNTHSPENRLGVKSVAKKELTEEMETKRSGPTEKRLLKGNGFEINKLIENKLYQEIEQ